MRKVGYYDSDFFTYANEEDLAIRVLNAGFKLKYMSNLVVYHKLVSKKKGWGKEIYYGGRNRFWICVKYFPLSKLSIAILRLFIKWGYFAFRKRELLNYFRGMLSGLRNIPQMRLKRQIIRHEVVKTLFDWQVYSTIYNKPILVILYNEIKRLISNVVS
jgi:GT2 family glycosyltransferase